MNLDDPRVIQPGGGAGFVEEAFLEVLLAGNVGVKDLDRHLALQGSVVALKHGAHPALAQQSDNPISSERMTDQAFHPSYLIPGLMVVPRSVSSVGMTGPLHGATLCNGLAPRSVERKLAPRRRKATITGFLR